MNRRAILSAGAAALSYSSAWAFAGFPGAIQVYEVEKFGARGDGNKTNTASIQSAIDAASGAGGGVVVLRTGDYLSGGLVLRSNVIFYLGANASLRGSKNLSDYESQSGPDPHSDANTRHLIFARDADNVVLCGPGRIDGQGPAFWIRRARQEIRQNYWKESVSNNWMPHEGNARPSPMLEFVNCKNLRIEGITLANSPGWTMRPIGCESVFISGIRIRNPVYGPNTDGIDITCCQNVFISNCDISTGDDAICLKSENPYGEVSPTQNITVSNCVLTGCCNGLKLGTATKGTFKNITFTNSVIYNEPVALNARVIAGIAVEMVDGGSVEGVLVSNIRMQNVRTPFFIRLGNRSSGENLLGTLRGVMFDNIHATGAILTSSITGLPGHNVEDVSLANVYVETLETGNTEWATRRVPELPKAYPEARMFGRLPCYGFYCRHASRLKFHNVQVRALRLDMRPMIMCDDVQDLDIFGLVGSTPGAKAPLIFFRNVRRGFVHGCCAPPNVGTFVTIAGQHSSEISLVGNELAGTLHPTNVVEGAPVDAISEIGNRVVHK